MADAAPQTAEMMASGASLHSGRAPGEEGSVQRCSLLQAYPPAARKCGCQRKSGSKDTFRDYSVASPWNSGVCVWDCLGAFRRVPRLDPGSACVCALSSPPLPSRQLRVPSLARAKVATGVKGQRTREPVVPRVSHCTEVGGRVPWLSGNVSCRVMCPQPYLARRLLSLHSQQVFPVFVSALFNGICKACTRASSATVFENASSHGTFVQFLCSFLFFPFHRS